MLDEWASSGLLPTACDHFQLLSLVAHTDNHETALIQRQWPAFLFQSAHNFLGLESGLWMRKRLGGHSAEELHQHLSQPHIMLLHIFPPHNKIIHNYLNTFNVLEQMDHNILEDFWGRCFRLRPVRFWVCTTTKSPKCSFS